VKGERARIVIIGGGFAGVECARTVRRTLRASEAEVVLFDRENHLVFQPLLAEVVGSSLEPSAICAPLRQMLPGVSCRTEEVLRIDFDRRRVVYATREDMTGELAYDHVVIACGGASNLSIIPGMSDHAYPMRTIGDAVELRAHVLRQLERAEVTEDEAVRRRLLSFVVVGGGYSGVEAAGEINDLVRGAGRFFPHIRQGEVSVSLVHSGEQILPEISPSLREFAAKKMTCSGQIRLLLKSRCASVGVEGVTLADGRFLPASTVVCTIGGTAAPLVERMPKEIAREKGRLLTEPDMRLKGQSRAWAIGDTASIVNAVDGKVCAPTGQFAQRQGRQCAANIVRAMRGEATRPFRFRVLGQLCSIGGHSAVAEMMGLRLSGFLAWFVWRGVYLFKLPEWSRRFKVGLDWAWDLVFPRDLGIVKADTTQRHALSYYDAGQYVFRAGDPASTFYVIQSGEAEVVRSVDGQERVIAVLKPGDFFGEKALAENRPRTSSIRARTRLEVLSMGRELIDDMTRRIPPLAAALKDAILRRGDQGWQNLPELQGALREMSVTEVMRSIEPPLLRPEEPAQAALDAFTDPDRSHCLVVDGVGALVGIVTLDDVIRWVPQAKPGDTVGTLMHASPAAVTLGDTALVAAETASAHGLRRLPVVLSATDRSPVGMVDFRDLMRTGHGLPARAPAAPVAAQGPSCPVPA